MIASVNQGASADSAGADNRGREVKLPGELLSLLADWTFLVGSGDDARWLESRGLHAVEWTRPHLRGAIRGRKLIVMVSDDEQSQRLAQKLGTAVAERGRDSVRVWILGGLGSRSTSLREWCADNDFLESLMRDKPWEKPREGGAEAVALSGSPRVQPPEFTGDPRPIQVELLPVPRLEEGLIPAPCAAGSPTLRSGAGIRVSIRRPRRSWASAA